MGEIAEQSPEPTDVDVRLSIRFPAVMVEFHACRIAALVFVHELRYRHDIATTVEDVVPNLRLPRLPNERLFLL